MDYLHHHRLVHCGQKSFAELDPEDLNLELHLLLFFSVCSNLVKIEGIELRPENYLFCKK